MFKYTNFNTSEDFEKWQEGITRNIVQIIPVPNTMRATSRYKSLLNRNDDIDMNVSMGVFVIYSESTDKND